MADEIITNAAPAATVTPEVSAPVAAPVETVSAPEPSQVETKVETVLEPTILGAEDAPKIEEKTAEVKPETKVETPEVKTEAQVETKPEIKTEEKPVETKVEEVKAEEKPAELPAFEWQFPDDVTVDKERISEVNKLFGEFALSAKVDPKLVQGLGQQLMERHTSEIKKVAQIVAESYDKVWKDQTKAWRDAFIADPEIGGNKRDTTVTAAKEFILRHGGTPEQQTELRTILQKTGLGNHPALIRTFAKANLSMAEPRSLPADTPPTPPTKLKNKMYGSKK